MGNAKPNCTVNAIEAFSAPSLTPKKQKKGKINKVYPYCPKYSFVPISHGATFSGLAIDVSIPNLVE